MRIAPRHLLTAMGGLVLVTYACNAQPGGIGPPSSGTSGPTPASEQTSVEPTPSPVLQSVPRPAPPKTTPQAGAQAPVEASPLGPMATEPTPLPKADQRIAIFHSSNVGGELDPCG